MVRFIAIDPSSTVTGWAIFQDDGLVAWGNLDARKVEYSYRFQFIINGLSRLIKTYDFHEIAVEDVSYAWHSKKRNRNIAGLQIVFISIRKWAQGHKFPLAAYNPGAWKNAIVGHNHASKETTKNNIRYRFPAIPDDLSDHEYDAIAIGVYHASIRKLEVMT